jgi:hypothetical protein
MEKERKRGISIMAKLTQEELEEIIERDAPGHRIVSRGQDEDLLAPSVTPDEGTPDLARLRLKFLGTDAVSDGADEVAEGSDNPGSNDVEMVTIEPDERATPWDHGSKPKVVIVSGKQRKIIGSQG